MWGPTISLSKLTQGEAQAVVVYKILMGTDVNHSREIQDLCSPGRGINDDDDNDDYGEGSSSSTNVMTVKFINQYT